MMGRLDDALGAVQDALFVGRDLLSQREYKKMEREMMHLVNKVTSEMKGHAI